MSECVGSHEQPVEAEQGWLCLGCFSRLRSALVMLPAVATWLEANLAAGGTAGERVSGSREAPIPLRADVLDLIGPDSHRHAQVGVSPSFRVWMDGRLVDEFPTWQQADQLRAQLVRQYDVDPHTDWHRVQVRSTQPGGPDQRGADAYRATLRHYLELLHETGIGWPDDHDTILGLTNHLAANLTWIVQQPWCEDFNTEIHHLITLGHRLAPWRQITERDPNPCTACGVKALVAYPADGTVRCVKAMGGCGRQTHMSAYAQTAYRALEAG